MKQILFENPLVIVLYYFIMRKKIKEERTTVRLAEVGKRLLEEIEQIRKDIAQSSKTPAVRLLNSILSRIEENARDAIRYNIIVSFWS